MIIENKQEQSSDGPLDHILMTEEIDHKCPHHRMFRHFKEKPTEPTVCHSIELKESKKSQEKESSDKLN